MKSSKLKDILDFDKTKWDMIFGKLKKLGTAIEMYYGVKMDIDNQEYRLVDDRIQYLENKNRKLTKEEMKIANLYWKKYSV